MRYHSWELSQFFGRDVVSFEIPTYQRAYAWENKQWEDLWNDINDYLESEMPYFLGTVLLRKENNNGTTVYEIIDGQQRITTLVILMRSLIDRLCDFISSSDIPSSEKEEIEEEIGDLKERYIKRKKNIKLKAIEYDRNFFENYIVNGEKNIEPQTPSQRRIKQAKEFFDKKLSEIKDIEKLKKIIKKIESAKLQSIEFENEKHAAFIFELQNDRGKGLTNLEKLKAFLMHRLFIEAGSNDDILYLHREFADIYRILNELEEKVNLDEDDILTYHCYAFTDKGFKYKKIEELKESLNSWQGDKILWIKNFAKSLKESFRAIRNFIFDSQEIVIYLKDLSKLGSFAFAYPFIIKAYRLLKADKRYEFLSLIEKIVFRHQISGTRADIRSRLNEALKSFKNPTDLDVVVKTIKEKVLKEPYWSNSRLEEVLEGHMYWSLSKYILKRYEIYLQKKNISNGYDETLKGIICIDLSNKEWQLEHIAPQTKPNGNSYDQNIYNQDRILHSIGNLLLVSDDHNIELGNKAFPKKLGSYRNSPFLHHKEIKNFATGESQDQRWTTESIRNRKNKLKKFVLEEWAL